MKLLEQIVIDRELDEFFYMQLFKEILRLIDSEVLKPYDKLPPIRIMSTELGLNSATVVSAYKLLEEAGLVHKKVGSGTFITPKFEDDERNVDSREGLINFASITPHIDLFPILDFKASMNEVIDRDGGNCFGYQEGKGYYDLRENFRKRLSNREIEVPTSQIQIVSGVQQGIDIVSKAVLNHGDTVIVESPTYAGAIGSFRLRGAKIVEMPVEIGVNELEAFIDEKRPKLMYLIPNFQNPTGNTYPDEFKIKISELASKYGYYIIEDDFASDMAFDIPEPDCIKKYDKDDRVIYLKSFSKLFMPGIRIGFMVVPDEIDEVMSYAKHTSDISTSGFMQRAFEHYLRSERFDVQFRRVFRTLRDRFIMAKELIIDNMKRDKDRLLECNIPKGGINFWFKLSDEVNPTAFFKNIEDSGINIVSGDAFFTERQSGSYFRISVAGLKDKEIEFGLKQIFKVAMMSRKDKKHSISSKNIPI